jgi:hypothetical protein
MTDTAIENARYVRLNSSSLIPIKDFRECRAEHIHCHFDVNLS